MSRPEHIAILGAGITGLCSAFYLSRRFPNSRITLIEGTDRVGGWIKSERVTVRAPATSSSVVLEAGPRTLRPVDKAVLELIHLLDLTPELITVSKTSPAAKSRFLHVPELSGGRGLLPLPSDVSSLLSPWSPSWPLSRILLSAVLLEPFGSANRPAEIAELGEASQDESVDSFMARRLGLDFARVFGSALVHGIYAADSRALSVRAAFPSLWDAESRGNGSILWGMMKSGKPKEEEVYDMGDLEERMRTVSVMSFKEGIETLPKALSRYLVKQENVRILTGKPVCGLSMLDEEQVEVILDDSSVLATHVVSTLPLPVLHEIISSNSDLQHLPHLTANPASTVTVVNLVFAAPPASIHPAGFGYLVPRPQSTDEAETVDPITHVLPIIGTVFDSCSLSEQDEPPKFTKITVMIKGSHPLSPSSPVVSTTTPADIPELILDIMSSLSTHLSRALPDPIFWRVHLNRDCIPTYLPGHRNRIQELTTKAKEVWKGRLEIVGSSVGGVSVGDCVRAARNVGKTWI